VKSEVKSGHMSIR